MKVTTMIFLLITLFLSEYSAQELPSCNNKSFSLIPQKNYICKVNLYYDKTSVPLPLPLHLDSQIRIHDLDDIDEFGHSITIYLTIRIKWHDPGLSYVKKSK